MVGSKLPILGFNLCPTSGSWHSRRCGSATMLSIMTDIPCIGVAKKLLAFDGMSRESIIALARTNIPNKGDSFQINIGEEIIGSIMNATGNCNNADKLNYISVGSGLTLELATVIVLIKKVEVLNYKQIISRNK